MKLFIAALFFFFAQQLNAQETPPPPPPPDMPHNMEEDSTKVFDRVEIEANFPGGDAAWRAYLERNFRVDSVTELVWKELPKKQKAKKGIIQITAIVQFVVCKDGSLCNIQTLNKVPAAFKSEAERLIAESKSWTPAEQNGRPVKAYRKQPITMQIEVE